MKRPCFILLFLTKYCFDVDSPDNGGKILTLLLPWRLVRLNGTIQIGEKHQNNI